MSKIKLGDYRADRRSPLVNEVGGLPILSSQWSQAQRSA